MRWKEGAVGWMAKEEIEGKRDTKGERGIKVRVDYNNILLFIFRV